ncbi:hypothetical protein JTE90_013447 [Oedothorax gibbosus]|uniref:receptor protein-tyrosine kinase n=1 Tax=Oedothorax gibbosus TaxID=931172 RepID=A0AAV6VLG4_9ARAC|nr:hypothetical protein JTE90_013447 [Oedothorax gibbosus]
MNQGHFRAGMLLLNHTKSNEFRKKKNTQESFHQNGKYMKLKRYFSVGQLLLKLLFPTLWTMANIEEADAGKQLKPKLNVTETYIDVELNSTLCLLCKGENPLSWGFKDQMNRNKKYQNVSGSSKVTYSNGGIESVLCTVFTHYLQTGSYACYHDNQSTSLYVFVNDKTQLLLPLNHNRFLTLHEGTRSVIPCLPTSSSAQVTLWKVKQSNPEQMMLRFDPTIGFQLRNPTPSFKGNFYCLAEFQNTSQKLDVNVDILPQTQSIPEVSIDDSGAKYVLLNTNFSLRCKVKIKLGTVLSSRPRWSHPVNDENRVIIGNKIITKNSIHKMISENLTVLNAQKTDEGIYQCNVTDHSDRENYSQVEVKVYESPLAPAVNFDEGMDVTIKTRGENAYLIAPYTVFPYTSDVQSVWTKDNGQLILATGKYVVKPSEVDFVLEIYNLTRKDSGIYTLTALTVGGTYNKYFHLRVKDTPTVVIQNSSFCCFIPGQTYQLHCESKGFPTPSLSWSWKSINSVDACSGASCNTSEQWRILEDEFAENNISQWFMNVGEESVWSILNITAHTSGYHRCSSENEIGIESVEMPFIVSEIPNGFDIEVDDNEPLENTSFHITCKASLDLYGDLQWRWIPENGNKSQLMPLEFLNRSTTARSMILEGKFDDISKNQSGNYLCFAFARGTEQPTKKSIQIHVIEKQEPTFINKLWNTALVAPVNSILELECAAEGIPMPRLTWYRNGEPLESNMTGEGKYEKHVQRLRINRLVEEDSGQYACYAENVAGTIMRNVTVSVTMGGLSSTIQHKLSGSTQVWIIVVVGLGATSFLILFLLIGRWFYKKKYKLMKLQGFDHQLFREGQISFYDPNMPLDSQAELLAYDERWEFPKENLKFGRCLGQGAFGRVVKAEAFGLDDCEISTTVAVKMLKERADINQQKALVAELKILIHLGHHVNIVNLMGAVTKNIPQGELLVMVEYCRYGNLRNYLLRHRDKFINDIDSYNRNSVDLPDSPRFDSVTGMTEIRSDSFMSSPGSGSGSVFAVDNPNYRHRTQSVTNTERKMSIGQGMGRSMSCSSSSGSRYYCRVDSHEHVVTTSELLCFSFQAACGMNYLALKNFIHRDLAARNVLLADDKVVKICDFGLAKNCYKSDNYVKKGDGPLPIKWMAIESIRDHVFTTKSDVWSFGVLMYEFFTLGGNPYPGIDIDEGFYKRLSAGYRMEKPDYCPEDAYQIMQNCWKSNPDERPNFNEISDILGSLLEAGVKQHYIDLNEPYLEMNCKMQTHDYSNMPAGDTQDSNRPYINSDSTISSWYDHLPAVHRSIFEAPITNEVFEPSVPMIQLETIEENNEFESSRLTIDKKQFSAEYLKMGEAATEA